jgi:DNA-binding NtrC family response regulator
MENHEHRIVRNQPKINSGKVPPLTKSILIVDDDLNISRSITRRLRRRFDDDMGLEVTEAYSIAAAHAQLESGQRFDAIFCDLKLSDGYGWQVIDFVNEMEEPPPVVVISGSGDAQDVVTALRKGACDFLLKPFTGDQVSEALARACFQPPENSEADSEAEVESLESWRFRNAPQFLGEHASVLGMLQHVRMVAATDSSVLITGESGTGKELVSRALQMGSTRCMEPFVVLNCAAIPENLIESEFFGHAKGAFTGATANRKGHFVAADGGTIFLDEVGELPLTMQAKLLRVLQEKEVVPVGETSATPIDVRVIAATNVNLEKAVEEGRFRSDLFFRLNVIPIEIPALRERVSDIPLIAQSFVQRFSKKLGKKIDGMDESVLGALKSHDWPGNVRQLENAIQRMVVLKSRDGKLGVEDLPSNLSRSGVQANAQIPGLTLTEDGIEFNGAVEAFEANLIKQALDQARGNKAEAARLLRLRRTTFLEKLKKRALAAA